MLESGRKLCLVVFLLDSPCGPSPSCVLSLVLEWLDGKRGSHVTTESSVGNTLLPQLSVTESSVQTCMVYSGLFPLCQPFPSCEPIHPIQGQQPWCELTHSLLEGVSIFLSVVLCSLHVDFV